MKPELDERLLSQFHAPIVDSAKRGEATRAMPVSDAGFRSLEGMLGGPMEVGSFLCIAIAIASALGRVHQDRLVHKDVKPANILVNPDSGEVRFTGFGLSSRTPRERPQPRPPESIAGTLAYMAPEQTGRMNRSIDSRSDLYALGVTLYQMLTGSLPFTATDPMEWVHCHIARKPVPPSERLENVPAMVSAIIMRLLVKTPEDRYQTAGGVGHDLRRCLAAWEAARRIDDFPLGEHDVPDRLLIPEKLYGRAREVETLLTAFDRMVTGGKPELVLVSGYSGIGKSSVVNELHKVLVPPRGLFASGKFDQYKRDIPYATLAQAFQGLVRYLLGKSEVELSGWRDALAEAVGPNGLLMIDLVPELKLIIGDQPPVPELSPQDARSRFQVVFRRFISVFAQHDHPLALFLDDLQWLDAATLDLLEDLLTPPGVPDLMLIGAYRDNEVTAAHPLTRKLESIRSAGANVHEIALAPLACEDVRQLVADALRCDLARATPLAQLAHGKTAGNPFFLVQFLQTLAEEGWLVFDHEHAQWSWDLDRIHAKRYRDNVVDLMVGRLNRLPLDTQKALEQLACLGNIAPVRTLALILEKSAEDVGADLWEAVRLELVEHLEGSYQFVHDRVQEAAYSLIPEAQRGAAHLRIGRLLVAHIPLERREEAIFDIVNQFNRSAALITSRDEREQVAELNLLAGKRAKSSTAYASALKYLVAGAALQPADSWERQHAMSFELELHRAECEFLTGALAVSEERLKLLSARAENTIERARVASLRVNVCTTLDQSERAVEVCLEYLAHLGVEWPPHPAPEQALDEFQRIWSRFDARSIEDLIDLPLMSDPAMLATLDVLNDVIPPALFTDRNLLSLVICRMVNLSLEYGNSDASCFAYVFLGMIAGPHFDNYAGGFQFGRLGYELTEKRGLQRYQARTYMAFGNFVMPWTRHVRTGRDLVRRAFDIANKAGDLTFAAYSCNNLNTNLLAAGDALAGAQLEAERGLEFAQRARFGLVIEIITAQLQLIRTLRGLTPTFGSFDCEHQFDERRFEDHLASRRNLALPECWYWIRKLQARVLAGDYRSAIDAASKAQPLLWTSPSFFETAEYEFYGGLARAGFCDSISSEEQPQHRSTLSVHHKQLEIWATHCPENFESRAALVGAEIARIDGRVVDAEQLYEQAIRSAHEHGFVQNEGLAYEFAARFYAARGFDDIAHLYLRRARHRYARWGADGKVRQLDERYPRLRDEEPPPDSRATIGEPVERLELATVLKVSQAVSGEIVLEKLVDTVLRTAIEHAGAERGLLLLPRGSELLIRAEGKTLDSSVTVRLCERPIAATDLPQSVVRYAARTREAVILADASARDPQFTDEYIRATGVRSVLCLPLVKQGSLVALLYLENRLASGVFTPSRTALLEVLTSQAAISLENSGLYRKLQQGEAEIRRLVDANVVGVLIWELEGRILEANDAFLRTVGYERADLASGRLRWTDLTPAEWRERDERTLAELNSTGTFQPIEKEYFRKDGSRVPVLIGGAAFDEGCERGVAFVVDLTERKCAEEDLKRQRTYLDELFNLAPDAIVLTSINDPRNVRINQEFTRMFGYTSEEAVGQRLRNLIVPDDLQPSNLTESPDLLAGKKVEREVIRQRKDGTRFHAHSTAKRVALLDNEDAAYIIYRDITERKCAEEELRRSQHYLAEAQKVSHTGSWAWSPVYNAILYWSEECYRILGYDPAQGLPSFESTFERIHPEDRPALAETIERAVREKADFQIEYRLMLPDGTRRNVRVLSHTVLDASGKLVEFVGTVMDVTEQKRASQERRAHLWFLESMDRINRAMQRSNDVELMTSGVMQEALEIFACDRACLSYPCDPDTPTHRTVMEHTSPEYDGVLTVGQDLAATPEWTEVLRRALHHPEAVVDPSLALEHREQFHIASMLAIAVRPRGDQPYLFVVHCARSRPWTAAELRLFEEIARRLGDALTSVLAHRNLLAREKELRRSQHYLAEGQKLSHTGSWAWNPISNAVRYWSAESYRIYGFDSAQGIPPFESTWERVHPEDRDALREAIERGVREKARLEIEHRLVLPGGIVRNHRVRADPVLNASGELIEYLGTVVDVTEQKVAEEERKEHLWFLECMDRVNRAMQRTNDVEGMMSGVLEETLAIFASDRAWLVYPCDPDAATSRVVMEHTRPEYPGAFALGEEFPVDTEAAELLQRVLDGPGAASDLCVSPEIRERFSIESIIAIAVHPKGDKPYMFGLHQCSHARAWTAAERRLFEEIARRLGDALTSVLAHRDLLASQEELRASEERFRTFVDHATDAFFLYDEECSVLDVNRQACEALGYTREELIGMHPTEFNEDMTRERTLRIKERLQEHGSTTFSARRRRKDGSLFPVEERIQAFNRGGRVLGIGLARDITERRFREQRLLAQYRITQTLSKASSFEEAAPRILRAMCEALEWNFGALWQVDPEEDVLRCIATWPAASAEAPNFIAATRAITFGPGAGLPGRVWSSGGPVCIRDVALAPELPRAKSFVQEGLHAAFAFPVMLKSGIVGVIELFSREVRDADRGFLQMMAAIGSQVAQFIERTRAEDALRHAREKLAQASRIATVAELAASIAHEINQPLQAIVANGHASLRWLDATPPNIEKAINTAKRVVRDGNAAADVVSRIRALFKYSVPAKVDVDINKLILEVRSLMADQIQGSGVSLDTELREDVPEIRADAVQIQQVIVNLVRNAIEAMAATIESPKPLWIRSRREEDNVVVDVQDHGVGLADSENIFEPFITTKETGLGMGLAICRSIIEAHAGRIWATRNPEGGVTFSFSLPIENSVTG